MDVIKDLVPDFSHFYAQYASIRPWLQTATTTPSGTAEGPFQGMMTPTTPMGSTAYDYAAGGPVMSPGAEGILVTPAAPMTGIARTVRCSGSTTSGCRSPPSPSSGAFSVL